PAFHTPGGSYAHGQVHDLAARAAGVLLRRGATPRSRVLVVLSDDIGWVVTFLAAARIGATPVITNPALTPEDHVLIAGDCDAALVVTTGELAGRFAAGNVVDVGELLSEAVAAEPMPPVTTDAPLYVYYTSGTTGAPKGVAYRQGSPAVYHRHIGVEAFRIGPDDVTLSVSKLYFGYGFCNTFVFPLHSGSSAVLVGDRPTPAMTEELVRRHGVTMLYSVPSGYGRLVAEADGRAFTTVRMAVSGGEQFPAEKASQTAEFLSAPLFNQLGLTEVGCAATANGFGFNRLGTVGRPVSAFELQVRDADGAVLGDQQQGELWIRPVRMTEYLNQPELTGRTLVDGWFRSGDRVSREPDGSYLHHGRMDDLEMVGGIKVSPLEVEAVLGAHPGVEEIGVAAVPDEVGATKLRAFVVPADPAQDPAVLERELIELARRRLAPFKVPRSVRTVESLPRTHSGKLRRFELRGHGTAPLDAAAHRA
ncbi:acyl-CoA synthase, partial [Saccharopolyspora erythraea D]